MTSYRKYIIENEEKGISEKQIDWGVTVLNVGHNQHPARTAYPDTNHPDLYFFDWHKGRILNEFQIIFIANGTGIFEAEKVGTVEVMPGTVFLLFPGVWHRYKPSFDTGWEEYWVGFKGSYPDHLMHQDCFNPDSPLIQIGFNAELLHVFAHLIDTLKFSDPMLRPITSSLTIQLLGLVYASALLKEKKINRKQEIINNIRYKLHENLDYDISMKALARNHNVSYIWFRKAFKEIVGISPGQYLLNLRLDKASQLLKETALTVTEISFQTGFESESHFSRTFKKKNGIPPSLYRKSGSMA